MAAEGSRAARRPRLVRAPGVEDDPTPGDDGFDVTRSGIACIYDMLDDLVATHDLVDAWIVVEDPVIGRQLFRAGRRPIGDEEAELLDAHVGLHTRPSLRGDTVDTSAIETIAALALALEVTRYEAGHDALTGLLGRRRFDEELEGAVARSARHGWRFCLAMLDIDGLKRINDERGHAAGDAVIVDLAQRLRSRLRISDIAARVGGDEFALILPEIEAAMVPALLERVRLGTEPGVGFTAGIAECPSDTTEVAALVEIADLRLRAMKQGRAGR